MLLNEEMYLENSYVGEGDEKSGDGGMRVDIGDDEDDDVDVGEDEEGKGEEDGADGEEKGCSMPSLVKKCARLHTQLTSLYNLKHNGITQLELCQIILKVLTLLSATVDITYEFVEDIDVGIDITTGKEEDESTEIAGSVSAMAIDDNEMIDGKDDGAVGRDVFRRRRVKLYFDTMGCILGGNDANHEEGSMSMLKTLPDGTRVINMGTDNANEELTNSIHNIGVTDGATGIEAQLRLEEDLSRPFALPSPARESLLSVALLLMTKKAPLRSVSNTALYASTSGGNGNAEDSNRWLFILHWRALLRMLLRTAPYLDEHKAGTPPMSSSSRQSGVLKRTVTLIRSSRRFFDQGVRPPGWKAALDNGSSDGESVFPVPQKDSAARALWDVTRNDLLYHTHSNSCFRALIMLYLFHPSRCSSEFYLEVMPQWLESWSNVDRCPEFDFLWMVMFCRARKYVSPEEYDWGSLRRYLLTQCGYWLQIPVGGVSADKSFPRAAPPGKRSFPSRLKAFVGSGSKYEEGIDFVSKVTKLLVFCAGPHTTKLLSENSDPDKMPDVSSDNISEGSLEILRFLSFVKPYFNPSNIGTWTFPLGAFLHYLSYELCHRVGNTAGLKTLKNDHPNIARQLLKDEPYLQCMDLPGTEIVAFLDSLLPLAQQALYSKNGNVSHAGETSLLYLTQIDPARASPPLIDFSLRALDVSSVNLSHQAPAALSALSRLLQPGLRRDPSIILSRLPEILRLTLAGIDSNDQSKTLRTLIFYRNLVMWVPVGGSANLPNVYESKKALDRGGADGTMHVSDNLNEVRYSITDSPIYKRAFESLPESSVFFQASITTNLDGPDVDADTSMREAMLTMSDWSLAFLDRVYEILRAAGEQEKVGKGHSGVASRHTSVDVAQAKNFSRIMKETLCYFFSSMDDETFVSALRSVTKFLEEETLPHAAKDASLLCQAVASTRFDLSGNGDCVTDKNPGFDALMSVLAEDLEHRSNKSAIYRLRCLAGAVRFAGRAVIKHREKIISAVEYALSKPGDKHLFKTGCKLLRHSLSSQCEIYPISQCSHPMRSIVGEGLRIEGMGKSAQLHGGALIHWHVPSSEQIDFTAQLLNKFSLQRLKEMGDPLSSIVQWRRCLRVLRYSLRGCSGLLLDDAPEATMSEATEISTHEKATASLILEASTETKSTLNGLRRKLSRIMVDIMSLIANDTSYSDQKSDEMDQQMDENNARKITISSDTKICKEVLEVTSLLLTRRGSFHRVQTAKSVWRGQKEILTDFVLASGSDYASAAFFRQRNLGANSYYRDGENGGKTMSSALLVNRVNIMLHTQSRNASFQIPRRLRKRRGVTDEIASSSTLFSTDMDIKTLQLSLKCDIEESNGAEQTSLETYECLIDGLMSMACHPNINVRGTASGVVEYAFSRFPWVCKPRTQRLLAAVSLRDIDQNGEYGIPSCSKLTIQLNSQGKRDRLAEVVKGVAKIIATPKMTKELLSCEFNRFEIIQTLCGTQRLVSLLPDEEVQKVVYYLNCIFLNFRSKFFSLPRVTDKDQALHESCLNFLLGILKGEDTPQNGVSPTPTIKPNDNDFSNKSTEEDLPETNVESNAGEMHWRNRLFVAWFLTYCIDESDLKIDDPEIMSRIWATCFRIIEGEVGQPLQRVSLGLLGRLVSLALVDLSENSLASESKAKNPDLAVLCDAFTREKFCRAFGTALVFDHREDTSVGGGHSAQWSLGVEEVLRDVLYNLAPRTLFPFQRISQKSHTFKLQHAQIVHAILLSIGHENAMITSKYLLNQAKDLVASPPSEDQRNQQCTAAEIFSGVCRALMQYSKNVVEQRDIWDTVLIPFLEEAVLKMPTNLMAAFFDACRYGIHHFPPNHFFPLLQWSVNKVKTTVWQHETNDSVEDSNNAASAMADRFALQSKWLFFVQAALIELDSEDDLGAVCQLPWYTNVLVTDAHQIDCKIAKNECNISYEEVELDKSWNFVNDNLIPCLLNALDHPYDKCRDHIASCLFRMCYCHRKFIDLSKALGNGKYQASKDPGVEIISQLMSVSNSDKYSFKEKHQALSTAQKFLSCCVHWGDAKHEFSEYIIPLLPLAFKSLQTTDDEVSSDHRGIEAETVKGFRFTIADISSSCVVPIGASQDMIRVLTTLKDMSQHQHWQIRQAAAHFLQCFQGCHKYLFSQELDDMAMDIAISLLADDRREVSNAATSALTGILAALPLGVVSGLVSKYILIANKSLKKKNKKKMETPQQQRVEESDAEAAKSKARAKRQQKSVYFLCAAVLGRPYDMPKFVPEALTALSKHSFEQRASLSVREVVKMCCSEFKRTHTDNWEAHKKQFTREQMEALEDVVSTPHYYA